MDEHGWSMLFDIYKTCYFCCILHVKIMLTTISFCEFFFFSSTYFCYRFSKMANKGKTNKVSWGATQNWHHRCAAEKSALMCVWCRCITLAISLGGTFPSAQIYATDNRGGSKGLRGSNSRSPVSCVWLQSSNRAVPYFIGTPLTYYFIFFNPCPVLLIVTNRDVKVLMTTDTFYSPRLVTQRCESPGSEQELPVVCLSCIFKEKFWPWPDWVRDVEWDREQKGSKWVARKEEEREEWRKNWQQHMRIHTHTNIHTNWVKTRHRCTYKTWQTNST